jgi:C4-type Zn-finger protein
MVSDTSIPNGLDNIALLWYDDDMTKTVKSIETLGCPACLSGDNLGTFEKTVAIAQITKVVSVDGQDCVEYDGTLDYDGETITTGIICRNCGWDEWLEVDGDLDSLIAMLVPIA